LHIIQTSYIQQKNLNPIHFQWFGKLFKHTYFDLQVHLSWHMHSTLPWWQQESWISHICMWWKIAPKNYKIMSFEYSKKIRTLKIYNMKRQQLEKIVGKTSRKHQQKYILKTTMKHQNSTNISFKHILSRVHIIYLNNSFHFQNQNWKQWQQCRISSAKDMVLNQK
jgi:hypothetical protein